jgi:hypothetical protein
MLRGCLSFMQIIPHPYQGGTQQKIKGEKDKLEKSKK